MNDLEKYFRNNDKHLINKWMHYFDVYDRHFSKYRDKEIVVLEIGVFQGGSLQMWKNYFGPKAKIYGVDINPDCKKFQEENIEIFIGSQSDRGFLRDLLKKIPPIDILIDDGGHFMEQQIITFEELFSHVKNDGVYLCEDMHTSYWIKYGGGYKRRGTFVEYTKDFIDYLNAWHSTQRKLRVTDFTKSVDSIHYYDSIIVLEKKERVKPYIEMTGFSSIPNMFPLEKGPKIRIIKAINKLLRFFRLRSFYWK